MTITDVHGRKIGTRALATRAALLDALKELLNQYPAHNVTVKNAADVAGCSSAAFYQYFAHMDDAYRALAAEADGLDLDYTDEDPLWTRQVQHITDVLDEVTSKTN